jgi:hypothetical protein
LSWGYVAVAGATLVSGYLGSKGSKDAAAAAGKGYDAATAEQARQYDQTREDMMPWLRAGQDALNLQQRFLGGDMSAFTESPDYQFRLQQGQNQLEGSAAARGNLFGGGAAADLQNYGQGMASTEVNNWFNRLAGVAGTGQSTAQQLGAFGSQYGQQAGQNAIGAANARGSSYLNQAGQQQGVVQGFGNLFGQWAGSQNQGASIGPVVKQPIGGY